MHSIRDEIVIPTVLLPSLVIGRWWFVVVAAVVWPVIVRFSIEGCDLDCASGAAALATVNAAAAVGIRKLIAGIRRGAF